jgi:pyrrolidone-carboxylate peptidase
VVFDEKSSGRFVCNDLYYRLLSSFQGKDGPKIVSIHVPSIHDKTKDEVLPAVRSVIRSAIEMMSVPEDRGSGPPVG